MSLLAIFQTGNTNNEPMHPILIILRCIYDRKFFPKDLDPTKLSHILYAFANLNPDGTVVLGVSIHNMLIF